MPHYGSFKLRDYSNETSSFKFYHGPITAGTIAGFLTQFGALRTAVEGITNGIVSSEKWTGDDTLLSNAIPTDENAQRERKWLVRFRDTVTQKKYFATVPTADPVGRLIAGTDRANLAETAMAAFVTAFEAIARNEDSDANAIDVLEIVLVGRNI